MFVYLILINTHCHEGIVSESYFPEIITWSYRSRIVKRGPIVLWSHYVLTMLNYHEGIVSEGDYYFKSC